MPEQYRQSASESSTPDQSRAPSAEFAGFEPEVLVADKLLLFSLLLEISYLVGPRRFIRLIAGLYHAPREEERFVLFVDVAGSTGTAERLGDRRSHTMLDRVFSVATLPDLRLLENFLETLALCRFQTRSTTKSSGQALEPRWRRACLVRVLTYCLPVADPARVVFY